MFVQQKDNEKSKASCVVVSYLQLHILGCATEIKFFVQCKSPSNLTTLLLDGDLLARGVSEVPCPIATFCWKWTKACRIGF